MLHSAEAATNTENSQSQLKNHGEQASLDDSLNISQVYTSYMLGGFACTERNRSKAIGQFLTPAEIYIPLVRAVTSIAAEKPRISFRIVDPFCGDARLLCALLAELANQAEIQFVEVDAFDIDPLILEKAKTNLETSASDLPFSVSMKIEQRDAFVSCTSDFASYDVCITNPPWSSTKSLKAHAFKEKNEYEAYQRLASLYGRLLSERYPEAAKGRSFGTGAINLSRFGMALSMRLLKKDGVCGIVMPSSFTTDTSSAKLRKSVANMASLCDAHYYPAELKLFEGADQAAVALTYCTMSPASPAKVTSHSESGTVEYIANDDFRAYSEANGHILPLGYSSEEIEIIVRLSRLPSVSASTNVNLGREIDETRINERLCKASGYRFVKGFMIGCYTVTDKEKWFYNDRIAKIPSSAKEEKVVWRDISRVSQEKRIKAMLLPPGFVAGNSLGVATASDGMELRAFLGVLNSRPFEFLARTILTTNHVSAGSIKRLPYPSLSHEATKSIANQVDRMLSSGGDMSIYDELDTQIANSYGLSEQEYELVRRRIAFRNLDTY